MRFSLFPTANSDLELAPYRPGLVFGCFNALSWQIGIGTPMVLFAERLGATSFQVGLAYSFAFLLTPLQIAATALLPRYGFKRMSLTGWSTRSVFLVVPVVLAIVAPAGTQPWMLRALIGSVFLFCLFRTLGSAAATVWFIGLLPDPVRGRFFASDQYFSSIAGVATLITCSVLFALLPIYTALLIQYAIALAGATLSYISLQELPDIERPRAIGLLSVARATPRYLFAPTDFRRYAWMAVWYAVITTAIPPFAAYYLKVGARVSPGLIMLFEVLRYCGIIAGAWLIRRRIDTVGARPFFLLSLAITAAVAAGWWIYLRFGIGSRAVMAAIYFGVGLGAVCWTVADLNYLPKVVPAAERFLYIAIQSAATACLGGCAPILWGLLLKSSRPDGTPAVDVPMFQWFFVTVFASACVLSALVARLPEDTKTPVDPIIIGNAVLRPFRAATYLVNLIALPNLTRNPEKK